MTHNTLPFDQYPCLAFCVKTFNLVDIIGGLNIKKISDAPPHPNEVNLNYQDFQGGIIGEYVTIRHSVGDEMVDKSDKSTTISVWAFTPDGGIVCEIFESRFHIEFGLLHTDDQHLVTVKEVLQYCVVVLNAIAVELQEPAPLRQIPLRWCSSG